MSSDANGWTPPAWLVALLALPPVARERRGFREREEHENLMAEWDHDAASLPHEEDRR